MSSASTLTSAEPSAAVVVDERTAAELRRRETAVNALERDEAVWAGQAGDPRADRVLAVIRRRLRETQLELQDARHRAAQRRPQKCGHVYHYDGATCIEDRGHINDHTDGDRYWND
jgi:hypothetical protein